MKTLFLPSFERDLVEIPLPMQERVFHAIEKIREHPFSYQAIKLRGQENLYRWRVGDYRIFYEVDKKAGVIYLTHVFHRREAYR